MLLTSNLIQTNVGISLCEPKFDPGLSPASMQQKTTSPSQTVCILAPGDLWYISKFCSFLTVIDTVNHYSPACSPSPSQRRPLHSLPASFANSPALRWSLCPPAWHNTCQFTRGFTTMPPFAAVLLCPVMERSSNTWKRTIVPLSHASEALPSCRSGHGRGSTEGSHRAAAPQWRLYTQTGSQGWGLCTAPWPAQTPDLPTGPHSSWSGTRETQKRIKSAPPAKATKGLNLCTK